MTKSIPPIEGKSIVIPVPTVAPLGYEVTSGMVQEVWDTFIKSGQDAGELQSGETRVLMAILRAAYHGLALEEQK